MASSLVRFSNLVVRRSTLAGGSFRRSTLGSFLDTNQEEPDSSHSDVEGLTILSRPFYEKDVFDRFETTRGIIQRFDKMTPSVFRSTPWVDPHRFIDTYWKKTHKSDILFINMTGAKEESIKISLEQEDFLNIVSKIDEKFGPKRDNAGILTIWLSTPKKCYEYKIHEIKAEIVRNSGELKITFPKSEENEISKCFHHLNVNVID